MRWVEVQTGVNNLRTWACNYLNYTLVIVFDEHEFICDRLPYTASWKEVNTIMQYEFIEGGPWDTFKQAEDAVKAFAKKLVVIK